MHYLEVRLGLKCGLSQGGLTSAVIDVEKEAVTHEAQPCLRLLSVARTVMPANPVSWYGAGAGIQNTACVSATAVWIPAFAGNDGG